MLFPDTSLFNLGWQNSFQLHQMQIHKWPKAQIFLVSPFSSPDKEKIWHNPQKNNNFGLKPDGFL